MLDSIRNFVQLTEDIGTAGQPTAEQFELIADQGYRAVINIAMPDHEDSIDNEGSIVTSLGMNYFHIPVPFKTPNIEHIQQFSRILKAFDQQKVFVHCIMNYRVSAFMLHYLQKVRGYTAEQARSPIFDKWQIEPQWQAIVELNAEELNL